MHMLRESEELENLGNRFLLIEVETHKKSYLRRMKDDQALDSNSQSQ